MASYQNPANAYQNDVQISPAQNARLMALRQKHAKLSQAIEKESAHFTSDALVTKLKKEKLIIKEEIEGIRLVS